MGFFDFIVGSILKAIQNCLNSFWIVDFLLTWIEFQGHNGSRNMVLKVVFVVFQVLIRSKASLVLLHIMDINNLIILLSWGEGAFEMLSKVIKILHYNNLCLAIRFYTCFGHLFFKVRREFKKNPEGHDQKSLALV